MNMMRIFYIGLSGVGMMFSSMASGNDAGGRYGFFPSGAIGWIVSEEAFMQPLRKVISKLKLRASYGQDRLILPNKK